MAPGNDEQNEGATRAEASSLPVPTKHIGAGRPTKQTPENVDKLMHGLRLGMSRTRCAHLIGVTYETLKDWCKDQEFSSKCQSAEAEGIALHAENMARLAHDRKANPACVSASKFYLTTHDRENFAESYKVEHSGSISIIDAVLKAAAIDAASREE